MQESQITHGFIYHCDFFSLSNLFVSLFSSNICQIWQIIKFLNNRQNDRRTDWLCLFLVLNFTNNYMFEMYRSLFIVLIVVFWCHPDFSQVAVHLLHKSTQGDHHNFIHLNDVFYLTPYFFYFHSLVKTTALIYVVQILWAYITPVLFIFKYTYYLLVFVLFFWKLVLLHFSSQIDFLHFFTHMFFSKILLFPHFLHFFFISPCFPF